VFNLRHRDGRPRSGVMLSDGLLITAAEIEAMESVPELVILNCCHLGQVDLVSDGNRLAASIARELIDIGVRCVIVAGWAVSDEGASLFGQTFYQQLLLQKLSFGEAVFEARRALWNRDSSDITWGAFQAYGDAGWRAERPAEGGGSESKTQYASPEELLDDLAAMRARVARKADRQTDREIRTLAKSIEHNLKERCPVVWLQLPQIQSALGAAWRDLNMLEQAREAFLKAVQAEDNAGRVPIRDIEQLANVEARLGEARAQDDAVVGESGSTPDSAEALIDSALERLDILDRLVSMNTASGIVNAERSALRGSALKRKASLHARRILRADSTPDERTRDLQGMLKALQDSADAYRSAEGAPGSAHFDPYLALNHLALAALTTPPSEAQDNPAVALAQQCRITASSIYAASGKFWHAVMQCEALLVQRLLDGTLSRDTDEAKAAFEAVLRDYDETLASTPVRPGELDSVVKQLELLSRFFDALSIAEGDASRRAVADRLIELVRRIRPGRQSRTDRPPGVATSEQPAGHRPSPGGARTRKRKRAK
jgi:hypothetical protein